jgi:hypothetical protein
MHRISRLFLASNVLATLGGVDEPFLYFPDFHFPGASTLNIAVIQQIFRTPPKVNLMAALSISIQLFPLLGKLSYYL